MKGEKFEAVAKAESAGATAKNGGDWGWSEPGAYGVAQVNAVLAKLGQRGSQRADRRSQGRLPGKGGRTPPRRPRAVRRRPEGSLRTRSTDEAISQGTGRLAEAGSHEDCHQHQVQREGGRAGNRPANREGRRSGAAGLVPVMRSRSARRGSSCGLPSRFAMILPRSGVAEATPAGAPRRRTGRHGGAPPMIAPTHATSRDVSSPSAVPPGGDSTQALAPTTWRRRGRAPPGDLHPLRRAMLAGGPV